MLKCQKCNKVYKREKSLIKHEKKCKKKENKVRPSLDEMWEIILKQQKALDKQKKEIEQLKNIVSKEVKSLDILEWLNLNEKREINYSDWIKRNIKITSKHMFLIFRHNYVDSVSEIISQINDINKNIIPIYCFDHKNKVVYIYENKWIKSTMSHIKLLYDEINLQLLKLNIEYEKTLNENILYSRQHLENNEKLFLVEKKKKDAAQKKIKLELFNLCKISLNKLNKYKFYI